MKDFIIEKLTELIIKQDELDKKNGVEYIKKVDTYRDLIRFVKEFWEN
jgi:hypothetical protein